MTISREWQTVPVVAALGIGGVVAASLGFAPFESGQAWLAVLALWIAGACGLLAWLRVPGSWIGPLLVTSAATWGVAIAMSDVVDPEGLAGRVIALGWAASVAQAVLTFPTGRVGPSSGLRIVVIAGYVATALPQPLGPLALLVALVAGLALPRTGVAWAARLWALVAGAALAAGIVAAAGLPQPQTAIVIDPRLASEAGLAMAAIVLSTGLVRGSERSRRVEDVLLEMGPGGGDALTMRLASILNDPTLRIGYWVADQARYVDPAGRPMTGADGNARVMMEISHGGRRVARLEQSAGRPTDADVLEAIGRAAHLGSTNARLQADVERQRVELDASRWRLAMAADEERRMLTRRLEKVLDPRLAELESALERIPMASPAGAGYGPLGRVREVRQEIAVLARGLAPKSMDRGLAVAIAELAAASSIPVTVHADSDVALGGPDEAALFFVCSEALANVAKHARATTVDVRLSRVDGRVELEIHDDGVGGAEPRGGSGLRGLHDRIEAIGGTLIVVSPRRRGTSVRATVPDANEPHAAVAGGAGVRASTK